MPRRVDGLRASWEIPDRPEPSPREGMIAWMLVAGGSVGLLAAVAGCASLADALCGRPVPIGGLLEGVALLLGATLLGGASSFAFREHRFGRPIPWIALVLAIAGAGLAPALLLSFAALRHQGYVVGTTSELGTSAAALLVVMVGAYLFVLLDEGLLARKSPDTRPPPDP